MRQTTIAAGDDDLPAPRATSRWRWATSGRTLVGGTVVAAVLAVSSGAASAATTQAPTGTTHPGGPSGGPFGHFKSTTSGRVTALSGSTLTLTGRGGETKTVTFTASTDFRTPTGTSSSTDLAVGDLVAVRGTTEVGGDVVAAIVLNAGKAPAGAGPGRSGAGGHASPGGQGRGGAAGRVERPAGPGPARDRTGPVPGAGPTGLWHQAPGPPGMLGRPRPGHEVRGGRPVKVVVDFDVCASNAVCMGIVPEVFEVRDDGYLYILDENPPEELRERLRQAVNGCPTGAITLVDE